MDDGPRVDETRPILASRHRGVIYGTQSWVLIRR